MIRQRTEGTALVSEAAVNLVNVYEAKTNLSKLLDRVEQGEEIVLGRAGRPVARLSAYRPRRSPRAPGRLAGKIEMAPDFADTPEWLIEAFEEGG